MVEPLANFIQTALSQKSLSGGLEQLLQSGSQRGLVQQGNDGKTFINIKSFQLPLQSNQNAQANLQPGQQVAVRLQNGQIVIEPIITKPTTSTEANTEASRSIAAILNQLGVNSPPAQVAAQALLQSNIPLNAQVIQDLAQAFPQLNPESLQALVFLISRRLPISDSMLYWMTRMNARRENVGKLSQSITQDLDELQQQLAEDEGDEIKQIRGNLGEFHEQLQREFLGFQHQDSEEIEDDLKQAVQHALRSAEAVLSGGAGNRTLSETIVRLLAYLIQLQAQFEHSPHLPLLHELTAKVEAMQEALSAQSIQHIPADDGAGEHALFLSLPVWKDHEGDQLELLYKPSGENQKAGALDVRVDLSNLGPLLLHFGWNHPQLNIDIKTERGAIKAFLQDHIKELQDGLSSLGFNINRVDVSDGDIPPTLKPEPEPLHANPSGIDVKV